MFLSYEAGKALALTSMLQIRSNNLGAFIAANIFLLLALLL